MAWEYYCDDTYRIALVYQITCHLILSTMNLTRLFVGSAKFFPLLESRLLRPSPAQQSLSRYTKKLGLSVSKSRSAMTSPERTTSSVEGDEYTPLLRHQDDGDANYTSAKSTVSMSPPYTPLPKLQLGVCILIQFAEPITALCILPFINQLVSELDIIHGDQTRVGYYVGIIVRACILSISFRSTHHSSIIGRTLCSLLSRQ